jgi:hypothetical protein
MDRGRAGADTGAPCAAQPITDHAAFTNLSYEASGHTGFAPVSHSHAAAELTSGTLADDRISESSVVQHQAALTISAVQISADDKAGTDTRLVTAADKGVDGHCAQWTASGLADSGMPCGSDYTSGPGISVVGSAIGVDPASVPQYLKGQISYDPARLLPGGVWNQPRLLLPVPCWA